MLIKINDYDEVASDNGCAFVETHDRLSDAISFEEMWKKIIYYVEGNEKEIKKEL